MADARALIAALLAAVFAAAGCAAQDEPPPIPVEHPAFAAIVVEDADAAAAWYAEAFGLETRNDIDLGARGRILILGADGGLTVELLQLAGSVEPVAAIDGVDKRSQIQGPFKVGVYVDDADAAHAAARAAALDVDDRVMTDEALDIRFFLIRDPEGNRLQVFESGRR